MTLTSPKPPLASRPLRLLAPRFRRVLMDPETGKHVRQLRVQTKQEKGKEIASKGHFAEAAIFFLLLACVLACLFPPPGPGVAQDASGRCSDGARV